MDVEFSVPAQRSSEEKDEFQRSVKKFKENNGARSFLPPRKLVSYKDSLVGDIHGAYEQAFKFSKDWEEDYESETEMEPLREGMAEVKLSKETKARIRAPWLRALIVKVKLGHKQESRSLKVKEPNRDDVAGASLKTNEASGKVQPKSNYGPWMVVTRKKKNPVHVEASEDLNKSVHNDSADSNSETRRVMAGLNTQSTLEMRKDYVMEDCLENPSAGCQLDPRHISRNKRKAIAKNKGKGSKGLGIRNSKNSKSHKRLPNSTEGKSGLLLLSKELKSDNQVENGEIFIGLTPLPRFGWTIWYKNRVVAIPKEIIAQIRATPTETLGWFQEELRQAWKRLFPIALESISLGDLPLEHKA
nr:hypothetical protein CFP56_66316 [Quercus suber]